MQQKRWGNEYRTTIVCIDSYENRVPVGWFYNPYYPDGVRFHGVVDLLTKMENMLDEMHFPQSFSCVRTFSKTPDLESSAPNGNTPSDGKIATLAVRVLFRQNASWQGSITWLDKRQEMSFRSVLELLLLMDSAAAGGGLT